MSNRRKELLKTLERTERALARAQEQLDKAKQDYEQAFNAFTEELDITNRAKREGGS